MVWMGLTRFLLVWGTLAHANFEWKQGSRETKLHMETMRNCCLSFCQDMGDCVAFIRWHSLVVRSTLCKINSN